MLRSAPRAPASGGEPWDAVTHTAQGRCQTRLFLPPAGRCRRGRAHPGAHPGVPYIPEPLRAKSSQRDQRAWPGRHGTARHSEGSWGAGGRCCPPRPVPGGGCSPARPCQPAQGEHRTVGLRCKSSSWGRAGHGLGQPHGSAPRISPTCCSHPICAAEIRGRRGPIACRTGRAGAISTRRDGAGNTAGTQAESFLWGACAAPPALTPLGTPVPADGTPTGSKLQRWGWGQKPGLSIRTPRGEIPHILPPPRATAQCHRAREPRLLPSAGSSCQHGPKPQPSPFPARPVTHQRGQSQRQRPTPPLAPGLAQPQPQGLWKS